MIIKIQTVYEKHCIDETHYFILKQSFHLSLSIWTIYQADWIMVHMIALLTLGTS